jgi:NADH pyrophosphatase NudC (nudix superfamily)
MRIRAIDNRYCSQCQKTTRHSIQGSTLVCPLCCTVKLPRLLLKEK